MGENFALAGHLNITHGEKNILSLTGSLNVEEGEILWESFSGILSPRSLQLTLMAITLPTKTNFNFAGSTFHSLPLVKWALSEPSNKLPKANRPRSSHWRRPPAFKRF